MCDTTEIVKKTSKHDQSRPKLYSNRPTTRYSIETGKSIFSKVNDNVLDKPSTAPALATVLDINLNSTNRCSLSHKPGHLPPYLRNKTCNKNIVSVQMKTNKKQFVQVKKELDDLQNKAVEYYARYRESLVKLNKMNGNDGPPVIDDLQIFGLKAKTKEAITSPIVSSTEMNLATKESISKLKPITDERVLSNISLQVQEIQVHSFKVLQEFSDRMSLLNNQIKSETNSEGGDSNLVPAKIQSLFDEIEKKIQEEEEQQNTRLIKFMTSLKQIMVIDEDIPMLIKESVWDEYENYRKTNENKINELETKLDELILKLQQAEATNKRLEMHLEEKTCEVIANVKSIVELQTLIKSMQEKVMNHSCHIKKLENKLAHTSQEYQNQIDRLESDYNEEVKLSGALRFQINELNLGIAADTRALQDENVKLKNIEIAIRRENENLRQNMRLNEIMREKTANKRSKTEENEFRRESERRDEELNRLNSTILEMKEELIKRDTLVSEKTREISEMESLIKRLENRDQIKKFQQEIVQLQELITQKSKEIDQLKCDLSKTKAAFHHQHQSLVVQQRLLRIRSELIQTLQKNENSTRKQFAELNSELERMTYAVKQVKINQDVSSNAEALENLYTVKGLNKLEVKRQDQIITKLEEIHERNQKSRVQMEDKIARLENENAEMKRFINTINSRIDINARPCTSAFYECLRRRKRADQMFKVKKYNN